MGEKGTVGEDIRWICPLYGFVCLAESIERIDLDFGTALYRIPDELRYDLNAKWPDLVLDAYDSTWAIEITKIPQTKQVDKTAKATFGNDMLDQWFRGRTYVEELVSDLITVIRLQHKGKVILGPLIIQMTNAADELEEFMYATYVAKPRDYFVLQAPPYELREAEPDTLIKFWRSFQDKRKTDKLRDLETAIHRFNSSYVEHLEDILVDQIIALESLYLGDDKELRYKIAIRAAFLIAKGKKERKRVFKLLREAYKARSKIIHGAEAPENLGELIINTEEYLRQSIKRFLTLSERYTLNQLKKSLLDNNILAAGSLLRT